MLKRIYASVKEPLRLSLWISKKEIKMISLLTICEILQFSGGMIFPLLLVGYLGQLPEQLKALALFSYLQSNPYLILTACLASSSGLLFVTILKNVLTARVTSNREAWYAERLRANKRLKIDKKEIARGSHYYGRLAGTIVQIPGPTIIFTLSYIALLCFLPIKLSLLILTISVLASPVLALAVVKLGLALKGSIDNIIVDARDVALWKLNSAISTSAKVSQYYKAYFYRIFLVGVFGFANTLFLIVFTLFLLLNEYFAWIATDLQAIFLVFIIGRIYLSTLTSAVSNIVKTAAFLPSVLRVFPENTKVKI